MEGLLVRMCIEAATENVVAVDKWRRQRRTLEWTEWVEQQRIEVGGAATVGGGDAIGVNPRASKIRFEIHQTSQKLAQLAKLAKKTSIFYDPTKEIQELTAVIKQDITTLNFAGVDLQLLSNSRNEQISTDTTSHSTMVVDDLKNRLMSTTKEFKEVLTHRAENLKVHEDKRHLFLFFVA